MRMCSNAEEAISGVEAVYERWSRLESCCGTNMLQARLGLVMD